MPAPHPPAPVELEDLSVDLRRESDLLPAVRDEPAVQDEPAAGSGPVIDLTERELHAGELVESGAFTHARCTACGWAGPARRSRAVAKDDLDSHAATS
jgi:hypothetical protein